MSKYSALPDLDTAPDVYVSDGPSVDGAERAKQIESLRAEIELLVAASDSDSDEESEDEPPPTSTKAEAPPSGLLAQILSLSDAVEKVQPPPESDWGGPTLASLSSEVDSLTRLVGMTDSQATPLATTIATLQHQVALLTQPRQLDAVTRRLKTLAPHADESISTPAAPQQHGDKEGTPHLASLLRAQSRLEPLLPLPPALLARMRSLASVHTQAAGVRTSLATAGDEVSLLAQRERQVNRLAAQLQEAMKANAEVQRGNYLALAQRADRLGARVAALSGSQPPAPLAAQTPGEDAVTKDEAEAAQVPAAEQGEQPAATAATKAEETAKSDDKPEQDRPEPAGELVEE